jgi:hypothetical protein
VQKAAQRGDRGDFGAGRWPLKAKCAHPMITTFRRSSLATLKAWMGATHFLTRTLDKVRTEMSLHVLAYNLKRMIRNFGVEPLMAAIRT